ncbi:MAG TPA: TolC family protein [Spirochaetia bacterium]|nr:TolC family protein [Spirochaetia bacterium]
MIKTLLTLTALGTLVTGNLGALTVDDAVKQAREHNLGLETESLKVAQKADEKNFSFNRLYPSISTNATALHLNNLNMTQYAGLWDGIFRTLNAVNASIPAVSSSKFTSQLTDDKNWNLQLGVNVQFLWSIAAFQGIAQTLIDYDNAVISRTAATARLDRDVRKAFYQLLALHEATGVLESQLKVAEDRYKLAKLNFDAGLGSEMAMLQAEVALENRRPAVADQKVNEANAQAAFRILLNIPADTPLNLEGSLAVADQDRKAASALDATALVQSRLQSRWDVATARGAVKSLNSLADLQTDTLLPALVFGWSADPTVNAPFKNNAWQTWSNYAQSSGNFMVGLGWKLDSLLPGSTTGIQIEGLRRQAAQAEIGVQLALRSGEAEIQALVGKLKKSSTSLEGLSLALSLAQRSSKLTAESFQAGNSSFNDAQDADLQLQTARLQYLNEELNFTSTLADLDYALAADRNQWMGATHG